MKKLVYILALSLISLSLFAVEGVVLELNYHSSQLVTRAEDQQERVELSYLPSIIVKEQRGDDENGRLKTTEYDIQGFANRFGYQLVEGYPKVTVRKQILYIAGSQASEQGQFLPERWDDADERIAELKAVAFLLPNPYTVKYPQKVYESQLKYILKFRRRSNVDNTTDFSNQQREQENLPEELVLEAEIKFVDNDVADDFIEDRLREVLSQGLGGVPPAQVPFTEVTDAKSALAQSAVKSFCEKKYEFKPFRTNGYSRLIHRVEAQLATPQDLFWPFETVDVPPSLEEVLHHLIKTHLSTTLKVVYKEIAEDDIQGENSVDIMPVPEGFHVVQGGALEDRGELLMESEQLGPVFDIQPTTFKQEIIKDGKRYQVVHLVMLIDSRLGFVDVGAPFDYHSTVSDGVGTPFAPYVHEEISVPYYQCHESEREVLGNEVQMQRGGAAGAKESRRSNRSIIHRAERLDRNKQLFDGSVLGKTKVYPTLFNTEFFISSSTDQVGRYEVTNLQGVVVAAGDFQGMAQVNFSNHPAGIYIVRTTNHGSEDVGVARLIKQQ